MCCAIASSTCRFSHIVSHQAFFIISGQFIGINGRVTVSYSHWRGEQIFARYAFRFNTGHMSMFGTVFILHLVQKCLLVLGCIRSLVLTNNIHSLSHILNDCNLPKKSKICAEMRSIPIVGVTSAYYLDSFYHANLTREVQVLLPWSLLLG